MIFLKFPLFFRPEWESIAAKNDFKEEYFSYWRRKFNKGKVAIDSHRKPPNNI